LTIGASASTLTQQGKAMKKFITISVAFFLVLGISAFVFYKIYFPHLVADAMTGNKIPAYVPKRIQKKIEDLREPINKGTTEFVKEIHKADIPINKVINVIDEATEEDVHALLDELNQTKPQTTNQVFDIIKKHMTTDFDVEVFRKPFNEHFTMKMIRQAITFGNKNRERKNIDFETTKAIVKDIVQEKENEFSSPSHN
jgi:hypothetical protein